MYYNRYMKDLPCRLKNKYLATQQTLLGLQIRAGSGSYAGDLNDPS